MLPLALFSLLFQAERGDVRAIALFGSLAAGHARFYDGLHGALSISIGLLAVCAVLTWLLAKPGRRPDG